QGFYFSKPVPASEYERFVEEKKQRLAEESEDEPQMEPIDRTVSATITNALTSGFEVIYYVNTETGRYVEFSARGQYEDLQIDRSGKDFFGDTKRNIPRVVYSEDQERVALSLQKDILLAQIFGGGSFTMTYRLVIFGAAVYYSLRAVSAGQDDRHIVIGVSNVNDQVREASENHDGISRNREFFTIAQALSSDFESIYYVDTVTDDYTEFTAQGAYEDLQIQLSGTDFFNESQKNILTVVYEEDLPLVSSTINKENLLKLMETKQSHSIIYRLMINGSPTYYQLKIVMAEDRRHMVIGVANAETQIMREQLLEATRKNSLTYASIAQALAADYFSIYYVDTTTDKFVEFSSNEDYRELGIEKGGEDFFNLSRRNILRVVHPDDHDMILTAFTKENLLNEMAESGTFTMNYRLMFGDTAQYVSMKATKMANQDDDHMVIGVSNVDAQMRRERELHAAREKANRDALTGVKSKHAYDEMSLEINHEIDRGGSVPFAIAVCDVNGLKEVNDTQGHAAGDKLILDATHRICEIFKHSPVFRIGGDEFVVIMKGSDYEQRQALLERMENINQTSKESGGVIVACGTSQWQPGKDASIEEVFARADASMYENKSALKQ
ncbi:MAG: GGDEF domain-containing protein, partial [Firmicutes bacterium]|nr:GGDEF domain-containing protein [Bacillota bacterium]